MKKIFGFTILGMLIAAGTVLAENTPRTPLSGGTTNPVSPADMHGANIDPEKSTDEVPKKKSKGNVTATPAPSTPSKPATDTKSETTTETIK